MVPPQGSVRGCRSYHHISLQPCWPSNWIPVGPQEASSLQCLTVTVSPSSLEGRIATRVSSLQVAIDGQPRSHLISQANERPFITRMFYWFCSKTTSTQTGSGMREGEGRLVFQED